MSIEAVEAVIELIEIGAVVGNPAIVKCLRSALNEPQQRTWVGLTDEEHTEIQKQTPYTEFMSPSDFAALCQAAVEAKLKEKNG